MTADRSWPVILLLAACGSNPVETVEECVPAPLSPWSPPAAPVQVPDWAGAEPLPQWAGATLLGFAARYGTVAVALRRQEEGSERIDLAIRDDDGAWSLNELHVGAGRAGQVTAFPTRDGFVHLLWLRSSYVAAGGNPSNFRDAVPDQVAHSRWDDGGATDETIIFSARGALSAPTGLAEDGDGVLHLALSGGGSPGSLPSLHYLRLRDGEWSRPEWIDEGFYPSLVINRSGEAVIAYIRIGASHDVQAAVNPVWIFRTDDGCTGHATLVHAGELRAGIPSAAVAADDGIHVVWPQDLTGDQFAEDIWHSYAQAGAAWSPPSSVAGELPGLAVVTTLTADHGGALHLTFSHFASRGFPPQPPTTPLYARFFEGSWSVEPNPLGVSDGTLRASVDETGRVHLLLREFGEEDVLHYIPPSSAAAAAFPAAGR